MAFHSVLFIAAFGLFFLIYSLVAKNALVRTLLLLLFNLFFYAMLSIKGLPVLLGLAISDFLIAKGIFMVKKDLTKRLLLYLSLAINIGLILTFRHFTDWFTLTDYKNWPVVIGVSFFVFRSMGYVLDVFRETMDEPEHNFWHYLTWLSFFPLILAGPITPARDFLPQLKQGYKGGSVAVNKALFLILSGIIKKFILSNYMAANFVDRVFDSPSYFTGIENLMAIVGQSLVVYLDFGGYTDLMLGLALLLGFQINENFNFPYLAGNITEYWRRWHMSLSGWLNEYLFFPLNFSLRALRHYGTVLAVMITFLISGFWHGTAVHYTFWGLLHGLALSWDIFSKRLRERVQNITNPHIYKWFSILFTFSFLCFSGIFFKAPDMEYGRVMLEKVFLQMDFGFFTRWASVYPWVLACILGLLVWQWSMEGLYNRLIGQIEKLHTGIVVLSLVAVIFIAYQLTSLGALPFIYLEF